MPTRITMSDLRRFLNAGLRAVRNIYSWDASYEAFKACEFAQYLDLTAEESFRELDSLADKGWASFIKDDGFLETWKLTTSGLYAIQPQYRGSRFKKSMVPILEKAFDVVGERFGKIGGAYQFVAYGPWMTGENYGAAVIGIAAEDWPAIPITERLDLIEAVIACVRTPAAPIQLIVLGFTASDGIPNRLRVHRPLTGIASEVRTINRGLDLNEELYYAQLKRDVISCGMRPSEEGSDFYGGPYWWEMRQMSQHVADSPLWSQISATPRSPPQPREVSHATAKSMLAIEYFCAMKCAPVAKKPKRKYRHSEPPKDAYRDGAREWSLLRDHSYGRMEHLEVNALPSVADELIMKGVLDKALASNSVACSLVTALKGDQVLVEQVFHAARDQRRLELAEAFDEKQEKLQRKPIHAPAQYLVAFLIGLKRPLPFAILRQPFGHRAHIKDIYRIVARILVGNKMVKDFSTADDLCDIATRFRPALGPEIAEFDRISKASGKQVRYIVQFGDADADVYTSRYSPKVLAGGLGIQKLTPGQLPMSIEVNEGWLATLKRCRQDDENDGAFLGKLEEWCVDAKCISITSACKTLQNPRSDFDRRFVEAIDRERAWQVQDDASGTFTARISCSPMMVTLSELGDSRPPLLKIQIGSWEMEKRLTPDSDWSSFSGTLYDIFEILDLLAIASKFGLQRFCEENNTWIDPGLRGWNDQDKRHLGAGLIDAVLSSSLRRWRSNFVWEAPFLQGLELADSTAPSR